MTEIKLTKRYPLSRTEDITDAYMRGWNDALDAVQNGKFHIAEQTEPSMEEFVQEMKNLKAEVKGFERSVKGLKQTEPKMCANCKHLKKHNGSLADWVCDRKGAIVTDPLIKECDEMWEQTDCPWK